MQPWELTVVCSLNVVICPASAVTQWGSAGFTVNSRKHCHISTTDFCDTLKQAAPAGKVRVGCWVPMSKLHFIKNRRVFCHLISHNCSLTQSCEVKIFQDSFSFKTRDPIGSKNFPSNFHQTVAAMMNFNWTNIFSKLLGNHHRATNVY